MNNFQKPRSQKNYLFLIYILWKKMIIFLDRTSFNHCYKYWVILDPKPLPYLSVTHWNINVHSCLHRHYRGIVLIKLTITIIDSMSTRDDYEF